MVVRDPGPRGPDRRTCKRIAIWAAMAACVAWTLLYRLSQKDGGLPEFVYVNF